MRSESPPAENILPRSPLTAVAYVNLADARWQVPNAPIHVLDYGLDLHFGDEICSVTWNTQASRPPLEIRPHSLLAELTGNTLATDVSDFEPWVSVIEKPIHRSKLYRPSHHRWRADVFQGSWVLSLDFAGRDTIWIVAAQYDLEDRLFLPCSDEVLVVADRELAEEWAIID